MILRTHFQVGPGFRDQGLRSLGFSQRPEVTPVWFVSSDEVSDNARCTASGMSAATSEQYSLMQRSCRRLGREARPGFRVYARSTCASFLQKRPECHRSPCLSGHHVEYARGIQKWRASAEKSGTGSAPDGDMELAVFRFTLGIPGFDDGDLPMVMGTLLGSLLLLNHIYSSGSITPAQWRSEALGMLLAVTAIVVPAAGRRLKEARRGRAAVQPTGRRQVLALQEGLREGAQQEVAWSTYALLRNTTTSVVMLSLDGEMLCARGCVDNIPALGSNQQPTNTPEDKAVLLVELAKGLERTCGKSAEISAAIGGVGGPLYIPNGAGSKGFEIVPSNAASLLVQSLQSMPGSPTPTGVGRGAIILVSENPRAYGPKDRAWVAALARKLETLLVVRDFVA